MSIPIARYKDLCIDAADAPRAAAFWSAALGLAPVTDRGAIQRIAGPTPRHTVWVNAVAEPRTAKNRLHVDVHCGSVAELVALGAAVVQEYEHWTVMTDPDGGEFCAFVRAEPPPLRLYELVLDAADPIALGRWWAAALGAGVVEPEGAGLAVGSVPGAPFRWLCVDVVPEPKTATNRVHLDVTTDDPQALVAHGATVLREPTEATPWTVMADPEGNEFCAFVAPPGA